MGGSSRLVIHLCPDEEGGRIIVKMERECLGKTTVYVLPRMAQLHGKAWSMIRVYLIQSTLKCPAVYKLFPKRTMRLSPRS